MPTMGTAPLDFIRHNLLTLDSSLDNPRAGLVRTDGTVLVKLVDVTDDFAKVLRGRNRTGHAAKVPRAFRKWWTKPTKIYNVMPANEGEGDSFSAYICPYSDEATHFKMLEAKADVMFTGDMDGCTFGVGMPNADGGVRVGHANAQSQADGNLPDPNVPQRRAQKSNLAAGGLNRFIDPDDYRLPTIDVPNPKKKGKFFRREFKAITIGLRINKVWEFYYQHQIVDGTQWREGAGLVRI